jgi:hypothetical protein
VYEYFEELDQMNWSARGNVLNQYLRNTSIGTTVNAGGWKGKEGMTQMPFWPHVKKPKSSFSPDWSIGKKVLFCF